MMLRYAILDILRDPTRLALTVAAIGIGVAQFVALFSFSTGLEREFARTMSGLFDRILVTPRSSVSRTLDDEVVSAIEGFPEVTGVVRKLSTVALAPSIGEGTYVTVAFIDLAPLAGEVALERGSASGALVGSKALERLRALDPTLDVGSTISLVLPQHGERLVEAQISGILANGGLGMGGLTFDHAVILPLEEAPPGGFDLLLVRVRSLGEMRTVADRIESELGCDATSFEATVANVINLTESFRYAFFLISAIAILIASTSTANTMMITVIERTREIGILKAIGFTRLEVVSVFMFESLVIGSLGSVLGCLLGVALSRTLVTMLIQRTGLGIVPVIDARILVTSVLIGTLIACISGAVPAKRAGDLDPLEALARE